MQKAVTNGANTASCTAAQAFAHAAQNANGPPPPKPVTLALDPISLAGNVTAKKLPPTQRGDIVVGKRGVRVSCGNRMYVDRRAPGFARAVFAPVPTCRRSLVVGGGRALMLRRDRRHRVDLHVDGRRNSVHVRHGTVRNLKAQVSTGGAYRSLPLDRRGSGTLPPDDNGTTVRVLLTIRRERSRETAGAVFAR